MARKDTERQAVGRLSGVSQELVERGGGFRSLAMRGSGFVIVCGAGRWISCCLSVRGGGFVIVY